MQKIKEKSEEIRPITKGLRQWAEKQMESYSVLQGINRILWKVWTKGKTRPQETKDSTQQKRNLPKLQKEDHI